VPREDAAGLPAAGHGVYGLVHALAELPVPADRQLTLSSFEMYAVYAKPWLGGRQMI